MTLSTVNTNQSALAILFDNYNYWLEGIRYIPNTLEK